MATSESRAPGGRRRGHEASDGALPRQVKAAQSLGRGTVRPYSDGMTMLDEARTGTDDATVAQAAEAVGCAIERASTARETFRALARDRGIRLVLLDLYLPDGGPVSAFAADVRAASPQGCVIVVVSGHESGADIALVVRTDLQGHGLGWALLRQIVDYARAEGIRRIEGRVFDDNDRMLTMCREFGFKQKHDLQEPGLSRVELLLSEPGPDMDRKPLSG